MKREMETLQGMATIIKKGYDPDNDETAEERARRKNVLINSLSLFNVQKEKAVEIR